MQTAPSPTDEVTRSGERTWADNATGCQANYQSRNGAAAIAGTAKRQLLLPLTKSASVSTVDMVRATAASAAIALSPVVTPTMASTRSVGAVFASVGAKNPTRKAVCSLPPAVGPAVSQLAHLTASASSAPSTPGSPPSAGLLQSPAKGNLPQRINISGIGRGGYRLVFLQVVGQCEDLEVSQDAADISCDVHLLVPCCRQELHRRLLRIPRGCRINHFPGMTDICEKVSFCRAVRQCAELCPQIKDYIPETWILPGEIGTILALLDETARKGVGNKALIVKPEYGLQGNGIFIVRTRADLEVALASRGITETGPRYVCQHYVAKPLTLNGFKFDMRVYLVVSSLCPLEAHLCREGLARFCTVPYETPTATNIAVRSGHLTNYALNSRQEGFAREQNGASAETASKRLLSKTLDQIAGFSDGQFNIDKFWVQLEEIAALLLAALVPVLSFSASRYFPMDEGEPSRCYHVLGLDVLLDETYRPYLLEVNSTPAMDIETAVPAPDAISTRPSNATTGRRKSSAFFSTIPACSNATCVKDDSPARKYAKKQKTTKMSGPSVRTGSSNSADESDLKSRNNVPWDGYRPSLFKQRQAWPEICWCDAHGLPHRHTVCDVDCRAKTLAISGSLQIVRGSGLGCDESKKAGVEAYQTVQISGPLLRSVNALLGVSEVCNKLSGTKLGLTGAGLRRALQYSEDIANLCGSSASKGGGSGRLGQHELDMLTMPRRGFDISHMGIEVSRLGSSPPTVPISSDIVIAVQGIFAMLLETSQRCGEKNANLASRSPLAKLEWLLKALGSSTAATSRSGQCCTGWSKGSGGNSHLQRCSGLTNFKSTSSGHVATTVVQSVSSCGGGGQNYTAS